MELDLLTAGIRWRNRCAPWRRRREPFNPADFRVEPLPDTGAAKAFIETHHSGVSFPAALACYALLERTALHQERLAGVAVLSVPIQPPPRPPTAPACSRSATPGPQPSFSGNRGAVCAHAMVQK